MDEDFSAFIKEMSKTSKLDIVRVPQPDIPQICSDIADITKNITPIDEVLAEQIKPILQGQQETINNLKENYNKLKELYQLKEKEVEESKAAVEAARIENKKAGRKATISNIVAGISLVVTIVVGIISII